RAYAAFVVRRRRLVLGVVLAISAVLAIGATRLRVEVDPDRNLPQDHAYIAALNEMHRVFGDKNLVVIGLFPNDGLPFTPAFLGRVAAITASLSKIPGNVPSLLQSVASSAMKDVQPIPDGISVEPLMETAPETQEGADAVRARVYGNPDLVG